MTARRFRLNNSFGIILLIGFLILISFFAHANADGFFTCSKDGTATEKSLCLDKDMQSWNKKLAKAVSGITAESRYGEQLLEATRLWNDPESAYDAYDLQKYYDFVKFGSTMSNCLTEKSFDECVEITPKCYKTSYTTLDMNRCDSAEVEVLELIEKFESAEFKSRNEGDVETINLFNEAYPLWTQSVDADCAWKFSHFRQGTMRSAVILRCYRDHLHLRIGWLHNDNDR